MESKAEAALDKGTADAKTMVELNAKIRTLEGELKLVRSEVKNLEGLGEMDRAEIEAGAGFLSRYTPQTKPRINSSLFEAVHEQ